MPHDTLQTFLKQGHGISDSLRPQKQTKREHSSADLPRRIHIFWDKGFDRAPDIVKLCVHSWQRCNSDWDIILLDQDDANRVVPRHMFPDEMKIAHYSDMLRTALLKQNGGVWVDASCLCLRPLDDWLPNIFNQCGFFAFHKPGQDRLISNWFLASARDSIIVTEMYAICSVYWRWGPYRDERPPYFWFHHLFEHLFQNHRDVRVRWGHLPKLSAIPVHQLKRLLSGAVADTAHIRDLIRSTPVQKLTHKQDLQVDDVTRFLGQIGITL